MRRGPLGGKTRQAPMRLGPLDTTAVLFGDVRAGRAAARSGDSGAQVRGARCRHPKYSFRRHGTDGKLSYGTWSRSDGFCPSLRPFTAKSPRQNGAERARRGRSRPGGSPGGAPGEPGEYSTGIAGSRLRIELQQRTLLGSDPDLDRKPERFEVLRQERMVVRPGPPRKQRRDVLGVLGAHPTLQEPTQKPLHLADRLS